MVSRSYLLDRKPPPSGLKRTFDQQIIPAAIDAAAYAESIVEIVAERTRKSPATALGVAFGAGLALALLGGRRAANTRRVAVTPVRVMPVRVRRPLLLRAFR